jgi:nicotinate-nucleotide pyrophosphorylase (carboxylating)
MVHKKIIEADVSRALAEDVGSGDVSAELLDDTTEVSAAIITREPMIMCGRAWVAATFSKLDDNVAVRWFVQEGERVTANTQLCQVQGNVRSVLTAERTALNFLQVLSGCATKTRSYVDQITHTQTRILDTRKTVPGLRHALKYAVKTGGGENHRMGLYDAYLLKENHIQAAGSITQAVQRARTIRPDIKLEVEVETLVELEEVLALAVDQVMLDNFTVEQIYQAVTITQKRVALEVSGNVTLDNVAEYAATGVDYISIGDLTKNIQSIDLSLRLLQPEFRRL